MRAATDICSYCGHPGAREVNHDEGYARRPDLALDPDHLSVIHGASCRCPHCPPVWSARLRRLVQPNCNGIVGSRRLADALADRRLKDW